MNQKDNGTFCDAIYIYNASFYQDRLGTNIGKALKKKRAGVSLGIALLFIVEFDEKVFKLMVPKTHQVKLRKEVIKAKNIANVFRHSEASTW